ncbi:MAG: glycogen debranching protein GlgX [Pseudomonadota bacterium]|nr:glycogen debranching protein GlgX [Pseudomonadota bacterium]
MQSVWSGRPYPLGATWDGRGVNFALFSEHAEKVELCVFDPKGMHEVARINVLEQTDHIWHAYLPDARPGLLYGYRVHGPYDPNRGHRFNSHKLLLDPYAKAIVGQWRWTDAHFGFNAASPDADLSLDSRDNARAIPKCAVIDPDFPWGDDQPPRVPWHETILYELHVKGFTCQHPEVPLPLRGTYAGLASAPVVEYLARLGITAVELLPVHSFVDDRRLVEHGLCNYWGYNSIGYFAPESRYLATGQVNEFKTLVKTLHAAGIEVILDVVYNHTGEGDHLGPSFSFRGIDNAAYYRLKQDNPRYYVDYTGCGNMLDTRHPRVLQLIMDSLRYWVLDMHVDGVRFDLAAALARESDAVNPHAAFFDLISQDPVLSQVKLIAEPWDLGPGGHQTGNFPAGWSEWNGRYRDAVREYWKGSGGVIGEVASRLTGSSDLYRHRGPYASINYITSHDGFTLQDLVSHDGKHNEANREDNRDGETHNRSWNCGAEGSTEDPAILSLRARQKRNLLATLLLSQGVPMLLAGDEMGRSQGGNNNAYCQDNATSWMNWNLAATDLELRAWVERLIRLRREHPLFRKRNFFQGRQIGDNWVKDLLWLHPQGSEISDEEWRQPFARCIGMYLAGHGPTEIDERGQPLADDDFLVLLNAHHETITFVLPSFQDGVWEVVLDTAFEAETAVERRYASGMSYPLQGRSLALLRQTSERG